MRFRKLMRKLKPVVIEAVQWFNQGDHPDVVRLWWRPEGAECADGWIVTLEGGHVVTPGDWIITGVKREHYPCKPDIFAATYDRVAEGSED